MNAATETPTARIEILVTAINANTAEIYGYGWELSADSTVEDAKHIAKMMIADEFTISARVMVNGGWA